MQGINVSLVVSSLIVEMDNKENQASLAINMANTEWRKHQRRRRHLPL